MTDHDLAAAVADAAQPLTAGAACWDELLAVIGEARLVLLGEASHGTHEFYAARAAITRRLIDEKGFDCVAVEADWPDALRVHRFLQGAGEDADAATALGGFTRFPRWMWRNEEVRRFIEWLAGTNAGRAPDARVGFYGLDLYSLHASIDAVVRYLDRVDPALAAAARARYACFDHAAGDPRRYGFASTFGLSGSCEQQVIDQLLELSRAAAGLPDRSDPAAGAELFHAQQNARVAVGAEAYYRSMFRGRNESWNPRDTHMADTLRALSAHMSERRHRPARIVVWAHNAHLGDARATERGECGELNLGQLVRQQYGPQAVCLVGFTTFRGTVVAASGWDAPAEVKQVQDALPDSYERLFHDSGMERFLLRPRSVPALRRERRLERAIGVVYLPDSERLSHYFHARIARQFDAVMHIDRTRALHPMDAADAATTRVRTGTETWPAAL